MNEYMTTREISDLLKVDVLTVRRWIAARKLPAIFLGKAFRVKKEDFDEFIKQRETIRR